MRYMNGQNRAFAALMDRCAVRGLWLGSSRKGHKVTGGESRLAEASRQVLLLMYAPKMPFLSKRLRCSFDPHGLFGSKKSFR